MSPISTNPDQPGQIVVTGATSLIGTFLLPQLAERGFRVIALSRRAPVGTDRTWPTVQWHRYTESFPADEVLRGSRALIHLAPLWSLPAWLPGFAASGVRRVIAFSSTSVFTKAESASDADRQLVAKLAAAEEAVMRGGRERGIAVTLFRPTLIYGAGLDRNVSTIIRFVRRFGIFPITGGGGGLRQPVHAGDLALACIEALDNAATFGGAYNLSGGETLSYRGMVTRVFESLGKPTRIMDIPAAPFKLALKALALLPSFRFLSPQMVDRMSQDMCFDHAVATRDFGFSPRSFHLVSEDLGGGERRPAHR